MIRSVFVKNYILIDELNLNFDDGFNVFTGETGAGKSIILGAIDTVLGSKATKEIIKSGQNSSYIELCADSKNICDILERESIEIEPEVIISREITQTSTRSRINGVIVTLDIIKEIRERLIDIHTQHQTYTYMQPKFHIQLLDGFLDEAAKKVLLDYKNTYKSYIETKNSYQNLLNKYNEISQKTDFLKFQIDEIEEAQIVDESEDKRLDDELKIIENSQSLKQTTYSAYWALYGNDENLLDALGDIKTSVSRVVSYDNSLNDIEGGLIETQETLKDIAYRLRDYSESLEYSEERLQEINSRIEVIEKLKRKYGPSLSAVLESYSKFKEEYQLCENSSSDLEIYKTKLIELEKNIKLLSQKLSESRLEASLRLSKLVCTELENLELKKAIFEIKIENTELGPNGIDNVEFMISTNVSESPKPLIKTASGGEISRVMLALKTVFANTDKVSTVIFDEIDTGISGKASQAVADSISALSKSHQVVVITHQPIIASKASKHFSVRKIQTDKTIVEIEELDDKKRQKAIAELASGDTSAEALSFAQKLLEFPS